MPENNKTEEFLQKLAPCIERGELEACVEEAVKVAREMGIGAREISGLISEKGRGGWHNFAYVLALAAAQGLDSKEKAVAYCDAGYAAQVLGKLEKAEELFKKAINANPKDIPSHCNYALLLTALNRKDEAEVEYKKAIEINPNISPKVRFNYANLLEELNREEEAVEQLKEGFFSGLTDLEDVLGDALCYIECAEHLKESNRKDEAEVEYKKAIDIVSKIEKVYLSFKKFPNEKPDGFTLHQIDIIRITREAYDLKLANVLNKYALLLLDFGKKEDAEEQYIKAIKSDPTNAEAYINYGDFLHKLDRKEEAEEHYKKAEEQYKQAIKAEEQQFDFLLKHAIFVDSKSTIEAEPKQFSAHYYYAKLLEELNRKEEAEEHYIIAIKVTPKSAEVHAAYGLLLIELNKRKDAWEQTEIASNLFKETGHITQSYLAQAWFYERYSEKNFNRKRFQESSEDADKAGEEYLKAAEAAEDNLKENLILQGNVLKARSFVRKIPAKSWYRRIYYRFGKNPYIFELINNLKNAAIYYEKASLCSVGEKDICNACKSATSVFSDILGTMSALIKGGNPPINKDEWISRLEEARKIYSVKELDKGVAFVDTLKQLIKCVDELINLKASGVDVQEYSGKCYHKLIEVSDKLDGALKIITYHVVAALRDYAKKQHMGFVRTGNFEESFWHSELIKKIGDYSAYKTVSRGLGHVSYFTGRNCKTNS